MKSSSETPQEYIDSLSEERKKVMSELRKSILKNLPQGFSEVINYGMIGYVVPHAQYAKGYHCDSRQPLPFMNIASQKNFIAVYHMGLYADKNLFEWFIHEYPNHSSTKLDIGKSCIRFKKIDQIPIKLIGELASKLTPEQWIELYETRIKASDK
jgi:hypothetical protein